MTDPVKWASKKLGYTFTAPELLEQALTHRSLAGSNKKNNERLEFLGDAVLDLAVAAALYAQKETLDEGELSRQRAVLVRRDTLAEVSTELGLGDILKLGGGEARSGGHQRGSILADALEAVFGAIYLDAGYVQAEQVISRLFADRLAELADRSDLKDPKTTLQELLQSRGIDIPLYEVIDEKGPPHDRRFIVTCQVDELAINVNGRGRSRRRAEQAAARFALETIQGERHDAS